MQFETYTPQPPSGADSPTPTMLYGWRREMSSDRCPQCRETGRPLPSMGGVDFYYCDACRSAWYFESSDFGTAPTVLTTPKKDRRRSLRYAVSEDPHG